MEIIPDGGWVLGADSITDPSRLPQGAYQWSQNTSNRGGILQTRQGFAEVASFPNQQPKGIVLFQDILNVVYVVVAVGNTVYKIPYPFTGEPEPLPNIVIPTFTRNIQFEVAVQAQETDTLGHVTILPVPKRVLIIQDGISSPWYWDGVNSGIIHSLYPLQNTTPVGRFMKWVGDRLWVTQSGRVRASDLLNPFQYEEESILASGGRFYLPAAATGMGITHDFKSLLVMTDHSTTAFQAGIGDRTQWPMTPDFQRVVFPNIGCASHRTIINQYGMTWWMSHNGLVGLDSALQAYLTSRIHVRDQNMARSKTGIGPWWQNNGYTGCGGTYGNFLFFSVPSGSTYNVHTWVMDGGVMDTLNQISPPAWSSNYTGIRPEQWATGVANGLQRCFCLSHDIIPEGRQATVWECFIGQRVDAPKAELGLVTGEEFSAKDIGCAVETKFYSLGQYGRFNWVELDLVEISGVVNLAVYYCGRKTSYKKILEKKLNARVDTETDDEFIPDTLISSLVPQCRTVRAVSDSHDPTDLDSGVQTDYIRSKDREFSILVTWTGQMALKELRIAITPEGDYTEGRCEENELTIRQIDAGGAGVITDDPVTPNKVNPALMTSQYLAPITPRWTEFPVYDSAVPNGVFFVVVPVLTPQPLGYPLNEYPKDITVSTETGGAFFRYTLDGTEPLVNHGTLLQDNPGVIPDVAMGQTLKVRGFREGMIQSAVVGGEYSQARTANPVFSPIPQAYLHTSYPFNVTITCATAGATMKYTTDGTTPSPTHGTDYTVPFEVVAGTTVKAQAYNSPNYLASFISVGTYTQAPRVATPTFTLQTWGAVTISTATFGAHLMYTLDGSDPGVDHGIFIDNEFGNVILEDGDILKAIGIKAGMGESVIATYEP